MQVLLDDTATARTRRRRRAAPRHTARRRATAQPARRPPPRCQAATAGTPAQRARVSRDEARRQGIVNVNGGEWAKRARLVRCCLRLRVHGAPPLPAVRRLGQERGGSAATQRRHGCWRRQCDLQSNAIDASSPKWRSLKGVPAQPRRHRTTNAGWGDACEHAFFRSQRARRAARIGTMMTSPTPSPI
jgi:hypothetical protein